MDDPSLLTGLVGTAVGIIVTLVSGLAWRLVFGTRELGSDAESGTYRTLRFAARAARHLRRGLDDPATERAVRELRILLACEALGLANTERLCGLDGECPREEAARIAARVQSTGRVQVFRKVDAAGQDAVAAPVRIRGEIAGAIVAFATPVLAPLVRATGEVADWVGSQLELGELDASRAALAEAELRALRAQISPHFIYNALNAIASFINTDPGKARELVLEFADFTRYSFRRQGDFTTLTEELRAVHSYLLLEQARFGDRLEVSLRIAPEVLSTVLPFLSVQPLVENAVRHGLQSSERTGRISIEAADVGNHTEITVEDNGVGMEPEALRGLLEGPDSCDHVGLRNISARMRQVYGADGELMVETNRGAGTLVRLLVPKSQPSRAAVRLDR